jgi:HAE1 family hydrophobic/amphiphilic exporter-1
MRSLLRFCVQRPLAVLAVYSGFALVGFFAWTQLPQELLPDLSFPQLTVVTLLPNAGPEEVENLVTKPIEQILGTVKNVRRVDSTSKEEVSLVQLEFKWDTDMDAALLWVQEKLGLVQDALPLEAGKPAALRYNPFDKPVLLLSVTGSLPPQELFRLVETRLRPFLEKIHGVSSLEISGGLEREIQVNLEAPKLASHRLSILEVTEALRRRNVSRSAGSVSEGLFEYPVTVSGSFATVAGFREAVVRSDSSKQGGSSESGALLRLGSLGDVTDGVRERASYARYDGRDTITVAIHKRAEAYTLRVADALREGLVDLQRQWPKDVRLQILYDQSIYINQGISDVFGNVVLGGLLAYLVLWIFLRSHSRSLIVGLTIPLALLFTITVLWSMGMTLNLLSLGGLALGVGMLVDSAVVIVENVSTHLDQGKSPEEAVVEGGDEVGGAVTFSILTTVAAFAPIPFASVGVAQRVFSPICTAVIVSQLASWLVSFTFVPSLMSLLLTSQNRRNVGSPSGLAESLARWRSVGSVRAERMLGRWAVPVREYSKRVLTFWKRLPTLAERGMVHYDRFFEMALRHRRTVLKGVVALNVVSIVLLFFIRQEVMPDVDKNQFAVNIRLPTGARLDVTDKVARKIEGEIVALPETLHRNVVVGSPERGGADALGPHEARIVVDLADKVPNRRGRLVKRKRTAREVMAALQKRLSPLDLEGARIEMEGEGGDVLSQLFGHSRGDLIVEVRGNDLTVLKKTVSSLSADLRKLKGVAQVTDSLTVPALQARYEMDESRLSRDGLSVADVADTVLAALHGNIPTYFREGGKEIPVRVRLKEEDRSNPMALSSLILTPPDERVGHPLGEYGRLDLVPGPTAIRRRDQSRAVLVSVFLDGRRVGDVLPEVENVLALFRTQKDLTVDMAGEVREAKASFQSLMFGFAASVVLVYIVLVAQFNLLWVPLLAMVSVPLSVIGVTLGLGTTGHTLNLMSGQGLMILAGIVVNNSLMLLEFIQQRRAAGCSAEEAVRQSARARVRPILMTVIGNVAGLLPLALAIGKGAELQAPMAVTVIFGLLVSTVLTLVVIPLLYLEARRFVGER